MKKWIIVVVIGLALALYFGLGLDEYLSLDRLQAMVDKNPGMAIAIFFLTYLVVAALNLPGVGPLTFAAGIIFGLPIGVLVVSFASTIGASISMLVARTLLRGWATNRFSNFLAKVNRGIEQEGLVYLFILRMIPIVPFFVINPVFGLTRMSLWKFYLVSKIGMLPATILYVNIGASLGALENINATSIFTPQIILSFAVLAVFPFIARGLINRWRTWRKLKRFTKPKQFDNNLIVIGGGAAGLVSSYIAATIKAKVTLIERDAMGGDCLNTGCVPSKTLIRSAKAMKQVNDAKKFGVSTASANVDFSAVMERVRSVIKHIEPVDSMERYESLGVHCIKGEAEVLSPYEVKVGDRVLTTKKIIIAAGARPRIPAISGLNQVPWLSSDTLWSLKALPEKLLVLGGGAIGCELAQSFARFGSKVTLVEMASHLLPNLAAPAGKAIEKIFIEEGVEVNTNTKVVEFKKVEDASFATVELGNGARKNIAFDYVLVAIGREANTNGTLMKHLQFDTNKNGTLAVDEYLQTSIPGIYACGDIVGPYQLTHAAAHQAWYASVNALLGGFKKFKVNYDALPAVVFTDPEVAFVGKTEVQLGEENIEYEVTQYEMSESDRAITEGEDSGFVQVLTPKNSDKILGVTIVGVRAGEMIAPFVSAKKNNKGLGNILATTHAYPTYVEANKFVAGEWKKKHKPEYLLGLVESWFKWTRG